MEVNNTKAALIDKVCIYDFVVVEIADINPLIRKRIVRVYNGGDVYLKTQDGKEYNCIQINDTPVFDSFIFCLTKTGCVYARMEVSINDPEEGNLNCFSVDDFHDRIYDIHEFLIEEYGIYADFSDSKLEYLELNKTVSLSTDYEDYTRAIQVLYDMFPGRLRLKNILNGSSQEKDKNIGNYNVLRTFLSSSGKKGLDICVYDKTKQLQQAKKKDITKQYLRYEIRLKSAKKNQGSIGYKLSVGDHRYKDQKFLDRVYAK